VTLGDAVKVIAQTTWITVGEAEAEELDGEIVPLIEKSIRDDGTIPIKVISPGWGSSGYYPPEVLQRDGPKVFKTGLHTFWNHPTVSESKERPERDLRDLAGVLTKDAYYDADGPAGPGLYAEAKVTDQYKAVVGELAPHIGMSIRAFGKVKEGKAEDKKGRIVEELASAQSVDFVTVPGAGGRILELFEAAGREPAEIPPDLEEVAMAEELEKLQSENAAIKEQLEALRREKAELKAAEITAAILAESDLPEAAKVRIKRSLTTPMTEDGDVDEDALRTNAQAAIEAEKAYLAEVQVKPARSGITGMGPTGTDGTSTLEEAFRNSGLSDQMAAIAARGRR